MRYRKKPIVIDAVQLKHATSIETLEGMMWGDAGDWLITGVKGEKYICRKDIFEMTYEKVE